MNRRGLLLSLTSVCVALLVLAAPVIADELFGVITKVDVEGKKLMVLPKGEDKETEVKVTDDTEWVTPKGASKIDLEKVSKNVAKAQEKAKDAGKDEKKAGVPVRIDHEKGVASKITVQFKKKAAPANSQ